MVNHVKNALITTAMVLATIYVLRQVNATSSIVDRAING